MVSNIKPLLEKYKVGAYYCGHDHDIQLLNGKRREEDRGEKRERRERRWSGRERGREGAGEREVERERGERGREKG
jgi:hypothetical protein